MEHSVENAYPFWGRMATVGASVEKRFIDIHESGKTLGGVEIHLVEVWSGHVLLGRDTDNRSCLVYLAMGGERG